MKTTCVFVALACIALSVAGCGSSPQNMILGKWETGAPGGKITVEFSKDGQAKITMFGKALQGAYKLNGSDELEWTMSGKTIKGKVKVTATELELTSEGKTIKYKKV